MHHKFYQGCRVGGKCFLQLQILGKCFFNVCFWSCFAKDGGLLPLMYTILSWKSISLLGITQLAKCTGDGWGGGNVLDGLHTCGATSWDGGDLWIRISYLLSPAKWLIFPLRHGMLEEPLKGLLFLNFYRSPSHIYASYKRRT